MEEKLYQFEKLEVWKSAVLLVKIVYNITSDFPTVEKFCLASQVQRAVVSIALNIAEGRGAPSQKEFIKFLYIALKSLYETVAGLKISEELGYVVSDNKNYLEARKLSNELGAKLRALINKVKKDSSNV